MVGERAGGWAGVVAGGCCSGSWWLEQVRGLVVVTWFVARRARVAGDSWSREGVAVVAVGGWRRGEG